MNRLDFGAIFKRTSSLNSTESKIDSEKVFKRLESNKLESIREGYVPTSYNNLLEEFINSMSNKNNASKYWYRGLEIIEKLNEHSAGRDARNFTDKYISRVLPYVENIGGVLEYLDRYNLTDYQRDNIQLVCEQYKLADKISNNHNQISKRFNIEYEVKSIKIKGIHSVVEKCCSMIDTYSYEPYQKLNMCIEEMVYLFEKNNIDYRPDELLSSVLEYFLLRSADISDRDIKGYKYVMEHNQCIDDTSASKFLFEEFDVINIKSAINDYLKTQHKSPEITEDEFKDIIARTSIADLKNNIDSLLDILYRIYNSQACEDLGTNSMLVSISNVLNAIVDRYEKEAMENDTISRDDVIELIAKFERYKSSITSLDVLDPKCVSKLDYKNTLGYIITNRLNNLVNILYSKDNIKILNTLNSDEVQEVALREFRIFNFNNIVKTVVDIDKFIKAKVRNFINKSKIRAKLKSNKIKNILFDESGKVIPDSIFNFIGDDNKVDICLCQIELDSEEEVAEALDELSAICKEFNNELEVNRIETVKSYYIINGCIAELHIKDSTKLILTEEEKKLAETAYKPELDIYIEQLALFEACSTMAEDFEDRTLDETIASIAVKGDMGLTIEGYDVAMDALSLIGANKNQVDSFTEIFSDYRNSVLTENSEIISENKLIKSIYNSWKPIENVPFDIQIEAYNIFNNIINEAAPKISKPKVGGAAVKGSPANNKSEDNKKDKNEDDYQPSQNISNKLNNIKIYLQGLKSKAKDLSQKEKELSRQLDANYNNFAKAVKNAFISDRRESIIKGSVIPSFSKSIKIAIGLAGLGIVSGNPIVPIVAALGGLAVSKKLTKRERILLLDEIETELEVVEKEIANADAKNQIKKYRALLQYKKDLQRQYQRIKYNVRVGKDILPGSAVGFKERN